MNIENHSFKKEQQEQMYLLSWYIWTFVIQYNHQPSQASSTSSHTLMTTHIYNGLTIMEQHKPSHILEIQSNGWKSNGKNSNVEKWQ
jgi:hypothetical protein